MKQDTKEKLGMVALVGVGLYVLTRDSDKGYAGGFGGGGGIPLLPGDTEGAAEGDTIINYILPTPEKEDIDWGIDPEPVSKKLTYAPSLMPTYPLEYYTSGGVSELSEFASPAQKLKSVMELQHYGDPFAYLFSGRRDAPADVSGIVESKKDAEIAQTPVDKPTQWGEASVGGFFDFLYPLTQLGEGARGRDIGLEPTKEIHSIVAPKKSEVSRAVTTTRQSQTKTSLPQVMRLGEIWNVHKIGKLTYLRQPKKASTAAGSAKEAHEGTGGTSWATTSK